MREYHVMNRFLKTVSARVLHLMAAALAAALILAGAPAGARSDDDVRAAALRAERDRAMTHARRLAAEGEQARAEAAGRIAALNDASSAARTDLASLQKDMVGALTSDDSAAMQSVRARLAARQAAVDANEGEKALIVKELEESERNREAWKKRSETIDLALRMDMKVMLAAPAEMDGGKRRMEAAVKEIDSQIGQIRKYAARRASAASEWEKLRARLSALSESLPSPASGELRAEREQELAAVRRLASQQREWFLLNRRAEESARRNLAFARTDYVVSLGYADALSQRESLSRATAAQAAAERAEARLGAFRETIAPHLQRAGRGMAAATEAADAALRSIAESSTDEAQEQARGAYAGAQATKARWEAETDCWKEFIALQKAGAAFAREMADRARGLAAERSGIETAQEERMLRGGLGTSEEYVRSLGSAARKLDDLIEAGRRELGLDAGVLKEVERAAARLLGAADEARALAPDAIGAQLQSLLARGPAGWAGGEAGGGRREDVALALSAHLVQREMLVARRGISERWIESSRSSIRALDQRLGAVLWRQHDPRLNSAAYRGVGEVIAAAAADAAFTWDSLLFRIGGAPGVPGPRRGAAAAAAALCATLCARAFGRRIAGAGAGPWLARRMLAAIPALAASAWCCLQLGADNRALLGAAWLLLGVAAWVSVRFAMLALVADHRRPAAGSAGDAVYAAINIAVMWGALLLPLHRLAARGENAWDVQAVIHRLWLFGVCVAAVRLLLHPAFLGSLLSRRSAYPGVRWVGATLAWACVGASALAVLPYLAGLESLGRTVLRTVQASAGLLAAALIAKSSVGWMARTSGLTDRLVAAWSRSLQMVVVLAAGGGIAWLWGGLIDRVVLAPNAPQLVREVVRAASDGLHLALRVWHHELASGMTVGSLARGVLVFAMSFWVARVVRRLFLERVLTRTPMDAATSQTFGAILAYAVILVGFLTGLNVAGSSLQNLALLAGAITVGLGFGLQNVINNFVSSLLIHFGRTIRVGDYIEVGGTRGTVREIGLRNTVIATDDGITVLIPNGSFISVNVVNWSNPNRRTRLHVPLVVTRQADLGSVAELATAAARRHARILKEPAPTVEVRTVTAAQLSLELLAWTEQPEKLASTVGELSVAIDGSLREKGLAV